eukprot:g39501.t1
MVSETKDAHRQHAKKEEKKKPKVPPATFLGLMSQSPMTSTIPGNICCMSILLSLGRFLYEQSNSDWREKLID